MDIMANILWLLHSRGVVLYFIFNPAWTLSVDIMLNVTSSGECVQPIVCKQGLMGDALSWSVTITPNDLFALGKKVHSIEGDIVLLTSLSYDENDYNHAQQIEKQDFHMCSANCSTFFSKQRHVSLQSAYNLTEAGRKSLFDAVNLDGRQWDTIIRNLAYLLSKDKWNTYILFASSYAAVKAISSSIKSPTSKLLLFTMDNGSQLNHTLDSLYMLLEKEDLNFIVVCSVTCIVDFLNQVYQFETMVSKTSNKWLMIPTAGSIGDIVNSNMQIPDADIVVIDKANYKQEYPVLSLGKLRKLLSSLDATDISKAYSGLTDYIHKTKSSVSANVYILNRLQKKKKIRRVGHISEDGDVVVSEDLFPGFKYGLKNRTLTVSTLEWPPFVIKKEKNGSVTYSGVCIDLLQELSRGLNFSYHIVEPEDQEWGRELDGRWTGLVGEMAYMKADLAAAPLTLLETRERVMDFTVPYFYVQSAIIMKKPAHNAHKWMTLVAPFRYEVHICILFSLIFSTVFLFVMEEIHPVNRWTDNRLSARRTRYGDILWYHFGALMANGGAYLPSSQAGRSVLSCWWLFTVISAAVYSGNLIAFLTDWREKPPFTTLVEMVEQDTYKWGTLGATSYIDTFEVLHLTPFMGKMKMTGWKESMFSVFCTNSNQSLHEKVRQGMQSDSELTSLDKDVHIRKVLEGQYAYLGDETLAQWWKSKECDLQVLHDPFYLLNYAIGLPNNSPYTSHFTEQVLRINELGLPRMWYKEWSSSDTCENSRSAKRVDLLALQSAFYAAGVGLLLCLSVLLAEVMDNRRKCRRDDSLSTTENNERESETRL